VAIIDKKDKVRRDCEVVKGRPKPAPPRPRRPEGLYIALGDSISTSIGASAPSKSWVSLYLGYLASSGSGVTKLENLAQPGHTTSDLRRLRLPRAVSSIAASDDTLRVTITIGVNDACDPTRAVLRARWRRTCARSWRSSTKRSPVTRVTRRDLSFRRSLSPE
jgi:lysophospholipase L1-like esterase